MPETTLVYIVMALTIGAVAGYYLRLLVSQQKRESVDLEVKRRIVAAKEKADEIIKEGREELATEKNKTREELEKRETQAKEKEDRLIEKEKMLDRRTQRLDEDEQEAQDKEAEAEENRQITERQQEQAREERERIAGLSEKDAREELFAELERENEEDLLARRRKLEEAGSERLQGRAKDILISSIHRLSGSVASEATSTAVVIPDEDAKGKIIGKEGRNIRAFEKAAGVELVIDETPGSILISAFDPMRRQIAKDALEKLLGDGRIQPAKIEQRLEQARTESEKLVRKKGQEAVREVGVSGFASELIDLLGRLHFRTSYGQNVLQHSIEAAHLAGMIAEELAVDVEIAKAGALVHDIGKALDHETVGTHVEIGRRLLRKYGAQEEVIQAMQAHHEEYPYETPESVIVQVADAISASRPGARRESVENYLNRLSELEAIANAFDGVFKSYALEAGREVRVFVEPNQVSEFAAQKLAREVAVQIEHDLKYPGEIKIHVMRESRYVHYAR